MGRVVLDLAAYETDLLDYIADILDEPPSEVQRGADFARIVSGTRAAMAKLASHVGAAVGRVLEWPGLTVVLAPHYEKRKRFTGGADEVPIEPVLSAGVELLRGTTRPRSGTPGFTLFHDGDVDDVLDAGDRDFFTEPEVERAYFDLVSELRRPGSTSRKLESKVLTLYTARPVKDRARYERATTVPSGIFLTSDFERAEALGRDLAGSDTGRDVWKVRIRSGYVHMTLDAGRVKEYQVVGGQREVPVERLELVMAHGEGVVEDRLALSADPGRKNPNVVLGWRGEVESAQEVVMGTLSMLESVLAPRLDRKTRDSIVDALKAAGLDGNGRFEKAERGYAKAVEVIGKFGLELDDVANSHLFRRDSGQMALHLAWTNEKDSFSPTPMGSMLAVSWHKVADDRFEVLAYVG